MRHSASLESTPKLLAEQATNLGHVFVLGSRIFVSELSDEFGAIANTMVDLTAKSITLFDVENAMLLSDALGLTKKKTATVMALRIESMKNASLTILKDSEQHRTHFKCLDDLCVTVAACLEKQPELACVFSVHAERLKRLRGALIASNRFAASWCVVVATCAKGFEAENMSAVLVDCPEVLSTSPATGFFSSVARTQAFDDLRIYMKDAAQEAASKAMAQEWNNFDSVSLEKQAFWSQWAPATSLHLLPMMNRTTSKAPSIEEVESADLLFAQFFEEDDDTIRKDLERIALFSRDATFVKKFLQSVSTATGGQEAKSSKLATVKHVLAMEALRVAGAKFLLQRSKRGEPPCCSFLKVERLKKSGADVEQFVQRPALVSALCGFAESLASMEKLHEACGADLGSNGKVVVGAVIKDARKLYEIKSSAVVTGMSGGFQRLVDDLESTLVPWKEFALDAEDVSKIKDRLINAGDRDKVVPIMRSIQEAAETLKVVSTKCGAKFEKLLTRADTVLNQSKEQIAASAAAVAIYITSASTTAGHTKANSMKGAKSTISQLGICLPMQMQARLQKAIAAAEEQAAKEKADKDKEKAEVAGPKSKKARVVPARPGPR